MSDAPVEFYESWIECMIEQYKYVLIKGDAINEASLRDMMLSVAGFTVEQLELIRGNVETPLQEFLQYIAPIDLREKKKHKEEPAPIEFEKHEVKLSEPSKKVLTHPDGYLTVNIAKSKITHYAQPGKKTTLCGKKWIGIASDPTNPMYTVCEKCEKCT